MGSVPKSRLSSDRPVELSLGMADPSMRPAGVVMAKVTRRAAELESTSSVTDPARTAKACARNRSRTGVPDWPNVSGTTGERAPPAVSARASTARIRAAIVVGPMRRVPTVLVGHLVMNSEADAVPSFEAGIRHRGPISACIFVASARMGTVIPTHGAVESVAQTTGDVWAAPVKGEAREIATVMSSWRM